MTPEAAPGAVSKSRLTAFSRRIVLSEYFVMYLTIVYFLIVWAFVPWLGKPRNLMNLLSNTWPLLTVAIGESFVLIVAGIDLSQVSIMAVSSVAGAALVTRAVDPVLFAKSPLWGWILSENGGVLSGVTGAIFVAIAVMLAIGFLIGLLNGVSVAVFRMPPFIVTLVTMMFFGAFAIFLTKSENIMNLPNSYLNIAKDYGGIFSISMGIAVGWALLAWFVLSRTLIGRWIYAVGINEKAARVSGVPTHLVIIFAYVFSGLSAVLAALLYSSRLQAGRPVLGGLSLIMDIIGANIIGGLSLSGGRGKITWTIFGVIFFVVLSNTLSQMNLNSFTVDMVRGTVILMAASLDVFRNRFRSGMTK